MALKRRAVLKKVLLTFDAEGKYVVGEALYEEGAWDDATNDWVGVAVVNEHPLHNHTPEGRKVLNDVVGAAALKALEVVEISKSAVEKAITQAKAAEDHAQSLVVQLADALGARDNFAKLHKEAKGLLMATTGYGDDQFAARHKAEVLLTKIPLLLRRMFGAI